MDINTQWTLNFEQQHASVFAEILNKQLADLNLAATNLRGTPTIIVSIEHRSPENIQWWGWYANCNDKMGQMFLGATVADTVIALAHRLATIRWEAENKKRGEDQEKMSKAYMQKLDEINDLNREMERRGAALIRENNSLRDDMAKLLDTMGQIAVLSRRYEP